MQTTCNTELPSLVLGITVPLSPCWGLRAGAVVSPDNLPKFISFSFFFSFCKRFLVNLSARTADNCREEEQEAGHHPSRWCPFLSE